MTSVEHVLLKCWGGHEMLQIAAGLLEVLAHELLMDVLLGGESYSHVCCKSFGDTMEALWPGGAPSPISKEDVSITWCSCRARGQFTHLQNGFQIKEALF